MKYTSGRDFRQALEVRLKANSQLNSIPLVRLRKQIAFERFVIRLQTAQPNVWILKGGMAMQLRLGIQSRTTKDIDFLKIEKSTEIYKSLVEAATLDLGDWFGFEVGQTEGNPQDMFGGHRYHVNCLLGGRVFEAFHVDVGTGDILLDKYDYLAFDSILDFAGIDSIEVPCYPITQQIAEKLHALTRIYESGTSTRVKDFIDILLLARFEKIEKEKLIKAIQSTFKLRDTHPVPQEMPSLSKGLRREYNRLAREFSLSSSSFEEAEIAFSKFINPILKNSPLQKWDAEKWAWG